MDQPLITYLGMPHSPTLDIKIGEFCTRLQDVQPRITSIHVVVHEEDRHKERGRLFEVRVDVKAPQAEIVANRQRHEDPYVAARDAFDAVLRQLTGDLSRKRETQRHSDDRGAMP
jgi:ribosome-associated translation inhibitor RaiA